MDKRVKWALKLALGLAILGLLFYNIGITNILEVFKTLNPWLIPIIVLIYVINFFLGNVNLFLLLKQVKSEPIRILELFKLHLLSWAVGLFTPGRLGEVSLIYFLKKKKVAMGEGLSIFFLDKLISLILVSAFAIYGVFYYLPFSTAGQLFFSFVCVLFALLFFTISKMGRNFIKKYILRKYAKHFTGFSKILRFFVKEKPHIILLNLGVSIIKWFTAACIQWVALIAFNTQVSIVTVFVIMCITTTLWKLIPITVSGIGIRESAGVYFYSLNNIDPSVVASMYLLLVTTQYVFGAVIFYATNYEKIEKKYFTKLNGK